MKSLIALFFAVAFSVSANAVVDPSPRFLVHLLGYIKQDYGGAVKDGKVLSKTEYNEQLEFLQSAAETADALPAVRNAPDVKAGLAELKRLIYDKAELSEVSAAAQAVESRVIALTHLEVAPARWPNRAHGKALYAQNCAQCHGMNGHGDGPSGKTLNPKPLSFHDAKMDDISPFQAFNAIRLGVPGTSMAAFATLSDQETWDLAFYVESLRHDGKKAVGAELPLAAVATSSDNKLAAKFSPEAISGLRLKSGAEQDATSFLPLARASLREAVENAARSDWDSAKKASVVAYLDGIEPIEPRLRARDASFTAALEGKMADVRGAIERRNLPEIRRQVGEAEGALERAEEILSQGETSAAFTFMVAAGIFLREAFEAVLILITLLGVLRSLGVEAKRAVLYVHGGWILAVGLGVVVWFFSGWLVAISGARREMLEGTISLFAVTVLLYFGFWLHRRTEIGKWRAFISDMVRAAVEEKNLLILGSIAFMAVFREAFETVLFLRALLVEAGSHQEAALAAGVVSSFVVVLALSSLLVRYSVKIPIRQLFAISSFVMVALALILIGKSMHSFQETGLLTITALPISLRSDLIGLYPTYETLLPQMLLLLASVGVWAWGKRPGLREHVA